ncbi:hypothetical protein [Paenibacillus sinopodophylli]|uniref:hypothetical protein n=1 Tax=Paenibacillus sinopodophylli TaxID=1837342 RepID=UPI001FE93B13|nr:hypothetical protein [Paenibacillus sinopodophylli]
MIKKFEDWQGDLHHFLKIGDEVDEAFQEYFLNVLPPASWTASLIQIGEPYSHVGGRATYATIAKCEGKWLFKGHCHRGQHTAAEYQVKSTHGGFPR